LSGVVTRTVPLDAGAINSVLDELEHFCDEVRTVVVLIRLWQNTGGDHPG